MYYYMILVLDPEFSAKEIRNAKAASTSINAKGAKAGSRTKKGGFKQHKPLSPISRIC
jgi:hypothetical protein